MALDGILPQKEEVEKTHVELPDFIPEAAVFEVRSLDDVDAMPRGAIGFVPEWDEEIILDLTVKGATIVLPRTVHDGLDEHAEFDRDGFGVLDEDGLWLPGVSAAYKRDDGGWRAPPEARLTEE